MRWRERVASVVLLLATAASAASVTACEGRPRTQGAAAEEPKKRSGPTISVFDLSGGVPEQEKAGLLGVSSGRRSFDELLRSLEAVREDKRSVGVVVKLGGVSLGNAKAQEIGELLEHVREKKSVFCHADSLSNATQMAALRGCSRIWMSPAGGVETVGIAAQIVYAHRLLADELHMSIDMLQVGKFKGAEEPLTRDGPSPEARESLTKTLVDMRASWIETASKARESKPNLADILEDGPYSPGRAKELGLIDEVGYADEMLAAAKTASSAVRDEVAFGQGAEEREGDLDELVRVLAGEGSASGPVALVRANGSIAMGGGGGGLLGGRSGIAEKSFNRVIARLERDQDVKAVVVRIDSPGGSALASDLMWHQLMKLRKKKPLVFSVGDMAASGGYYLACTGDYIYAEPMSIVGSIGVVGGKIGVGETLEKIGVHVETFPANDKKPGAASRAAYESPFVRWDEPTKVRVLDTMTGIYQLFLARVSEGRSTRGRTFPREKVAESAEGKIFSGREAKTRGLVDELGGLQAAIAKARELAELPANAHVAVVGGKPALLEALEPDGVEERARASASTTPLDMLESVAPDLVPFVTSLAPLAGGERAVVAVPYALTVR